MRLTVTISSVSSMVGSSISVGRLQMEEELDDEALLVFAFEVTTTPTIQLVHGFPYVPDSFTTKLLL